MTMKIRLPSKFTILYFIMLLSIFKPAYLPFSGLKYVYRILQVLSLTYMIAAMVKKKITDHHLIFLFGLYYFVLAFSTLINSGDFAEVLKEFLTTCLVVFWMHLMTRRNSQTCVCLLMHVFEFLIYVNLITVLLYPTGLYKSVDAVVSARYGWFLGHQSLFSMYAGPAICIAAIYMSNSKEKKSVFRGICLISACVIQTTILGSANNIICILVIASGTLIMTVAKQKRFPYKIFYFTLAVLIFVIAVFQNTSFMEPFVVNYLHRSMTFTDRTFIWTRTLDCIKDNWLLGCGLQSSSTIFKQIGGAHAHNQYLQCMYLGGIVLLFIFLLICFKSFKHIKPFIGTFAGRVMISAIAAMLIQMIFEVYFHHTMGKILITLSFYFEHLLMNEANVGKIHKRRGSLE